MIIITMMGVVTGWIIYHYIDSFVDKVTKEVYDAYVELFPQNVTPVIPVSSLKKINHGKKWQYCIWFMLIFMGCKLLFVQWEMTWLFCLYLSLICVIVLLDWHYQLISPNLCQLLWLLGMISASLSWIPITLQQSLWSSICGFFSFLLLYYLARAYYQQEALGRGDYWLVGALSSFISYTQIPLFILLACLLALSYVLWQYRQRQLIRVIPFAPFLSFSGLILLITTFYR